MPFINILEIVMKNILLIILLFSLNANASGGPEVILGYSYNSDGVSFQVESGGCTQKSDFSFQILEKYPIEIILIRDRADFCEAYYPYGTVIEFTYKEMGVTEGMEFVIGNDVKKQIEIVKF